METSTSVAMVAALLFLTLGRVIAIVNGYRFDAVRTGALGIGRTIHRSIDPKGFRKQIVWHAAFAALFAAACIFNAVELAVALSLT
ncbi:MAG TPA: hypothetical protein VF138_07215 [Caulobacteraceae bacterium]